MLGDYRKLLYEQEEAPKKAPAPEEEESFDDYVDKDEFIPYLESNRALSKSIQSVLHLGACTNTTE